jgi:hypothetical protein
MTVSHLQRLFCFRNKVASMLAQFCIRYRMLRQFSK